MEIFMSSILFKQKLFLVEGVVFVLSLLKVSGPFPPYLLPLCHFRYTTPRAAVQFELRKNLLKILTHVDEKPHKACSRLVRSLAQKLVNRIA